MAKVRENYFQRNVKSTLDNRSIRPLTSHHLAGSINALPQPQMPQGAIRRGLEIEMGKTKVSTRVMTLIILATEHGYKSCEKGENLQKALLSLADHYEAVPDEDES